MLLFYMCSDILNILALSSLPGGRMSGLDQKGKGKGRGKGKKQRKE